MSSKGAKILEGALKLDESERADVAACLVASLGQDTSARHDPAWEAEIERRLHAIDCGQAKLSHWEEARQRIFSDG